jgi:ribosomal protein S6--L-glutamate ligase
MGQDIILQEYIAESKGRDYRAIVVGGRVVAAMRRQAKQGEFRSNLHRGGHGVRILLERPYRIAAVAATRVMGLEVAGVDMLESKSGPKILEINSSPGLEGVERASGVDVAAAIIVHAERYLEQRTRRRAHRDVVIEDERRPRRLRKANGTSNVSPPPSRPRLKPPATPRGSTPIDTRSKSRARSAR